MDIVPARFPVIALGGSAGGLEAFFAFFEAYEGAIQAPPCAIVVVLHLAADAESSLPELLAARTRLTVEVVEDRSAIRAGHVYVLRPGMTFGVDGEALVTLSRAPGAAHHPLDDLFRGLAAACGARTVAIVCSGTGSNGSATLGAVREAGGFVIAQAPETAAFGEMPRRAIATGLVDVVAPPGEMIGSIAAVARRLAADDRGTPDDAAGRDPASDALGDVLAIARAQSSIDFTQYRKGTLRRRIERRVQLLELAGIAEYAKLLAERPEEVERLVGDLLITVTTFFRDEEAWHTLGETVLDPLLAERSAEDPIRVWVAGCATGEEVYTIAIMLLERLERLGRTIPVEIFATDVSSRALARARQGEYPAASVDDLPRALRDRWFTRRDDTVCVKEELREVVLFAQHNALQDPPFSRADLVICRNLLIYLQPEVQRRLLRLFHFALKERGALFLGSAEGLGEAGAHFEDVDAAARIFRRIGSGHLNALEFPLAPFRRWRNAGAERESADAPILPRQRAIDRALKALIDRHAPPSVAIDRSGAIVYHQGATDRYLRLPKGAATHDLFTLCHPSLTTHLRRLVDEARVTGVLAQTRIRAVLDEGARSLLIEAAPAQDESGEILLVSFLQDEAVELPVDEEVASSSREAELEDEIRLLRDELSATVWSARRAGEDLNAYNEEMTSMNEELRATNEELETSKEELQSLNEELRTVNSQLHANISELNERTTDLDNLLHSTDLATLFLGPELEIRWFSPQAEELFHIRDTDVGRPLSHVVRRFRDEALESDCRRVLEDFMPIEAQIEGEDGRALIRRVLPYRTQDRRVVGTVVTFTDVTEIHNARHYAESIVETVPTPILVLDEDYRVTSTNPAFCRTFDAVETEVVGLPFERVGAGWLSVPELRRLVRDILPDNDAFEHCEISVDVARVGRKKLLVNGRRLDHVQKILLVLEDVTEARAAQARQTLLMEELRHRVKNSLAIMQALASSASRRCTDLAEFRAVFLGRFQAYARGHDQLFRNNWRPSDLAQLATAVMKAHAADPNRLVVDGPAVALSAKQALAIALVLHELETNALKYGSLSVDAGTVSVRWSRADDGTLTLVWQETGGPTTQQPEREGFGTALVRQLVRFDLGGDVAVRFGPGGLVLTVTFPIAKPEPPLAADERGPA